MSKKRIGLISLIASFALVFIVSISFFSFVAVSNTKKKTYKGTVNRDYKDYSLILEISKTWQETDFWGQQFDFAIKDRTKADLDNWTLTIEFKGDNFQLVKIDSCWNVLPTVQDNVITLTPKKDITLASVKPKEANSFGFIFHVKNAINDTDFENFTFKLSGTSHRTSTSYPAFWVVLFLMFGWVTFLVAYIVFWLRERNFEKFKEHTYNIMSQAMNTFGSLIDVKDPYTKDHSARVSYYSVKIARKLGEDDEFCRNIAYIALMHDCGKLLIDDSILRKPAKLTDPEYDIMKTHTINGGKALENFTSIEGIKDGAMYHHERYDGSGYPKGLKGEEIPLCARIISVSDALDAMASDRCYRPHLLKDVIIKELENNKGTQFDPKIVDAVVDMINNNEIDITDIEIRKDAD